MATIVANRDVNSVLSARPYPVIVGLPSTPSPRDDVSSRRLAFRYGVKNGHILVGMAVSNVAIWDVIRANLTSSTSSLAICKRPISINNFSAFPVDCLRNSSA